MTYVQPLELVFLLITFVGLIRIRLRRGLLFAALGLSSLFWLSWPPADWLLSRHLEARYPPKPFSGGEAQAIVVLASGVIPPQYETPYAMPDKDTYEHCEFAAWLYKHWSSLPVLASGGPGAPSEQPSSDTMRQLLKRAGVPDNMIWTEGRSRSTHENAVYSAELLRKNGIYKIVLVTDAQSMLRAELCFRRAGLIVIPAPCEFRQLGPLAEELIPSWKAIYRNEITLHETLGLVWYRLRGWI
jgi:uncharacterized SAM-binding protein YcdF (DUF218 family)